MKKTLALLLIIFITPCYIFSIENEPADKDTPKKIGRPVDTVITYDLYSGEISQKMPFDVPFLLKGKAPADVKKIEIYYIEKWRVKSTLSETNNDTNITGDHVTILKALDTATKEVAYSNNFKTIKKRANDEHWHYSQWERNNHLLKTDKSADDYFFIPIDPLKANRSYLFYTKITYKLKDSKLDNQVIDLFKNEINKYIPNDLQNQVWAITLSSLSNNPKGIETKKELWKDQVNKTLTDNSEKIYNGVSKQLKSYVKYEYGLTPEETKLKQKLEEIIGVDDLVKVLELSRNRYLSSYNIQELNSSVSFNQEPELLDALIEAKVTEAVKLYKELNFLSLHSMVTQRYLTGQANITTKKHIQNFNTIENVSTVDSLISNLMILHQKVASLKQLIDAHLGGDKAYMYMDPEGYKQLSEKIVTEKAKPKDEQDKEKINQLEKQLTDNQTAAKAKLKTASKVYDNIALNINTTISLLYNYREDVFLVSSFWQNKLNSLFFELEQTEGIKEAFQKSTTANFMTRSEYYMSADFGFAHMTLPNHLGTDNLRTIQPYMGINFNLFPINRQAHYSVFSPKIMGRNVILNVLKGTSIVVGLTSRNIAMDLYEDPDATSIKGLWGATTGVNSTSTFNANMMLLSGLALRLGDFVRLGFGTSWYRYRVSYDPLDYDQYRLKNSFYVSLSLDLDVKHVVKDVIGPQLFGNLFNKTGSDD